MEPVCIMEQYGISLPFLDKNCLDYKEGKRFHATIIKIGVKLGIYFANKLIIVYSKHSGIADARQLFDEMSDRNVISWTALIAAYAHQNNGQVALRHFEQMQREGVKPNHFTFSSVLSACREAQVGKQLHARAITHGFHSDVVVSNAVINAYVKCGEMRDAHKVLSHSHTNNVVSWTSIVAGYGKCGNIEVARRVFDQMPYRNVVSWNAMIAAYAQQDDGTEALSLFHQMRQSCPPMTFTFSTFATLLSVSARLPSLQQGKLLHAHILKCSLFQHKDVVLESSLVDMYAKCGSIEDARLIFEAMPEKNVVSWTAMIDGYGKHGQAKEALRLFEQMRYQQTSNWGIEPNDVTFLSVLSACSHAGLVDEGFHLFHCMNRYHNISPRPEHYASMVDLLARAGCLVEARALINKMPEEVKARAEVWGALLGACRYTANVQLANHVAQRLFLLKPQHTGTYIALSNVYAAAGMDTDAAKVIKVMKDRGIKMEPGCSWIEVGKDVHRFLVGDKFHPQTEQIHATWIKLEKQMKEAGYVSETNLTFNEMGEEHREPISCLHSEKLAITFGLISTPPGSSIRIFKNLRVCLDCHIATKIISKIVDREIIVRDVNRFHHFKNGLCSCGDFW
ncbi:pentatricopeptide repeat-containing protein At3g12770 [Cryptomeria japonica]|uniref:pentatricopeptide repeat-containing protein At3g12770 n=1 Tax=Cryptomeria japonica TaxID=3369 RepID=UPI0027D9D35B|nr:pentatricopeptide repeat-containing protein At3g12770 [Cryptomeria japonica]